MVGNYVGIIAKRVMLLLDSMMPYSAMMLMAKDAGEIMDLIMMTTIWTGFNNPAIDSNIVLNSGTMPMVKANGDRSDGHNPLPILELNLRITRGFKNLESIEAHTGLMDQYDNRELFATKLGRLSGVMSYLCDNNACRTKNTALLEYLTRKQLAKVSINDIDVQDKMSSPIDKKEYPCIISPNAKNPASGMINKPLSLYNQDTNIAIMQTRLLAIGLFANADTYRSSVSNEEATAKTRLRSMPGLHPQLRNLLYHVSREQNRQILE